MCLSFQTIQNSNDLPFFSLCIFHVFPVKFRNQIHSLFNANNLINEEQNEEKQKKKQNETTKNEIK